ncbi:IS1/IS1595 family N-terminal zinc-binding domain-containing protein [Tunicatimonas pelagia]
MLTCPHCPSSKIVKKGFTSYGKQNYLPFLPTPSRRKNGFCTF